MQLSPSTPMSKKHRRQPRQAPTATSATRAEIFARVKRSTVAVVHLAGELPTNGAPLESAAKLLGSGFFVDDWTVATCSDVTADYVRASRHFGIPSGAEPPFPHVLLDRGTSAVLNPDSIVIDSTVTSFRVMELVEHQNTNLVLLHLARPEDEPGLRVPPLKLSPSPCEEGDDLVVCGFPLGLGLQANDGAGGIVLNASFTRTMVSSALPYTGAPLPLRLYFQLDGMVDVGQRGGPVFDPITGTVYGVMQERKHVPIDTILGAMKIRLSEHDEDTYGVPLGLGRGIHSHKVLAALDLLRQKGWQIGETSPLSAMAQTRAGQIPVRGSDAK